jgi:large subunit ribosomal protein L1
MPTPVPPNAPIENVVARHNRIVRVRVRDQLNAQCRIGSEDMPNEELADNIEAIISRLEAKLPKGLNNVREIGVKMTMGPFVKIEK